MACSPSPTPGEASSDSTCAPGATWGCEGVVGVRWRPCIWPGQGCHLLANLSRPSSASLGSGLGQTTRTPNPSLAALLY